MADRQARRKGQAPRSRLYFVTLSLAALGVVFGDIGTSPLYALQACFNTGPGGLGVEPTRENVFGVLSLVFWSLVLVVTVKYLTFVLRADNEGEGGILALMALVHPRHSKGEVRVRRRRAIVLASMGLFGAALLYGNGMITPAISVLSAMEGLKLETPAFEPFVIPLTILVIVLLFLFQKRGTAAVGKLFGPVMIVWFSVLALLGIMGIWRDPAVLLSLNPIHGLNLLREHGVGGFLVLSGVFLAVTGAEALYADMGHFGVKPIRVAWYALVLPALVLNYFGQGALLLDNPSAADNPFYRLVPEGAILPVVILATFATVIASQAIITGAFSLTMQAVQLGYSPRMELRHTSEMEVGQIYAPVVNWSLAIATVALVIAYRSSAALAGAYGIAVTLTMLITTVLFAEVALRRWKWHWAVVWALTALFLVMDVAFFGANLVKIREGGWVPIAVAVGIFVLMTTWRMGRRILGDRLRRTSIPLDQFVKDLTKRAPTRVRGHAVYMTGNSQIAPAALMRNLEHNRVLHFKVAVLSIITEDVPHVPRHERVEYHDLGNGFYRVHARYGFMDEPNAVDILTLLGERGLHMPLAETTFFLGRERLVAAKDSGMPVWREKLFGFMSRNAQQATAYFRIPPDRVIEVGSQVEL